MALALLVAVLAVLVNGFIVVLLQVPVTTLPVVLFAIPLLLIAPLSALARRIGCVVLPFTITTFFAITTFFPIIVIFPFDGPFTTFFDIIGVIDFFDVIVFWEIIDFIVELELSQGSVLAATAVTDSKKLSANKIQSVFIICLDMPISSPISSPNKYSCQVFSVIR